MLSPFNYCAFICIYTYIHTGKEEGVYLKTISEKLHINTCIPKLLQNSVFVVVVQSLSCVWLFVTSWIAGHLASLSFIISKSLLKLMSIKSVMLSNHLILCCPLLLLPSVIPSIRLFSSEWAFHIRQPNYWSFSFHTSPSNEYSGLTSSQIDRFALFAVQGTLKSLLQYHSSKESILFYISVHIGSIWENRFWWL